VTHLEPVTAAAGWLGAKSLKTNAPRRHSSSVCCRFPPCPALLESSRWLLSWSSLYLLNFRKYYHF